MALKTIGDTYIICEDCGKPFKQINMLHLRLHGYSSVNEYKDKYLIPYRTPLCAKETSRAKADNVNMDAFNKMRSETNYKLVSIKGGSNNSAYKREKLAKTRNFQTGDGE